MVQKMKLKNIIDIKWYYPNPPLKKSDLSLLHKLPYVLPNKFINLLEISNGGNVNYDFQYYDVDHKNHIGSGIALIYGFGVEDPKIPNPHYDPLATSGYDQNEFFVSCNNIIDQYYDPPEFFPKDLVPFAENGGGNLVCFDYRKDPTSKNPPIVYWNHEAEEGKDVSFLAKDFDEFLSILKEPEEDF